MITEANPAPAHGFIADASGERWSYEGPLTFDEAGLVLAASQALALPRDGEVDLAGIGAFDSSAVAVLVALARRAAREGRPLRFAGQPSGLRALATLYGVQEFLPA